MKIACLLSILGGFLLCAASPPPDLDGRLLSDGAPGALVYGRCLGPRQAKSDSLYVLGGPLGNGDFQAGGAPDRDGWTSVDLTEFPNDWHVDTYFATGLDPAVVPNHAWWCGDIDVPSCGPGDPAGGYGNGWDEGLEWRRTVDDPLAATTVRVRAVMNHDTEYAYDFLRLEYRTGDAWQVVASWDGLADSVLVDETFAYAGGDYAGAGGDEIVVRWRFESDGAWSDEDCLYQTHGAAQIDRISVELDGVEASFEDCEDPDPAENDWRAGPGPFVGDFARVWPLLGDLDPCVSNNTPQFAFIDDGTPPNNAPGESTGGYPCITWCYGSGGWVVNAGGGLAGPGHYIHNQILSPVAAWPAGYEGALLRFGAYNHQPIGPTSPGIFYYWEIRSTDSADPADIDEAPFVDRGFLYYGGPAYYRHQSQVSELLVPGCRWAQVALCVIQIGWIWGWNGPDATPAPYFDNVALVAFEFDGPAISARAVDLAQDTFPESGVLDNGNLAANSCRFDMARSIAPEEHLWNDPGDSIVLDVGLVRSGSVLADLPKLYYRLDPNPLFDPYRTWPNAGWVYGDSTFTASGAVIWDRYNFDLPDTGFFFPGDRLHYYVEAVDDVGGSQGVSILPPDTTGFADFSDLSPYPEPGIVRALPTVHSATEGDTPRILFWKDSPDLGDGLGAWRHAFANLGFAEGHDFDWFRTNDPGSGSGNGLGGRATDLQLACYDVLVYTCGDRSSFTLCNGDPATDPGDDLGVLDAWLRQGGKYALLSGDGLVSDLVTSGSDGQAFLDEWIRVERVDRDLRPLVGGQAAPTVRPLPGNGVFGPGYEWVAYGGCPGFNTFDAVTARPDATRLAEFLDPTGAGGVYPYAAATLFTHPTYGGATVLLPYDLQYVLTPHVGAKAPDGAATRARILEEVLWLYGYIGTSIVLDAPGRSLLAAANSPNPFNPSTRIDYRAPRAGRLVVQVFDVRGRLVRRLLDREVPEGPGHVTWDGRDDAGAEASSGLYLYEVAMGRDRVVRKAVLVR